MNQSNINTIALVCTGSTFAEDESKVLLTQNYLQEKYALRSVYQHDTHQYLSAQQRADIFLNYLFDPTIDAIWALRGGEGSADIIPFIDQQRQAIQQLNAKPLIGFSDFTPLLLYFSQVHGWATWHATGAYRVACGECDEFTEQQLMQQLLSMPIDWQCELRALNKFAEQNTVIEAPLTGGCLSLLTISIGDVWQVDMQNKIVIIEDVHEKAHAILRNLKYLQRIGVFDQAKAIIFGDFTTAPIGQDEQQQHDNQQRIEQALVWFAARATCPVLSTNQIGHGRSNRPWRLRVNSTLQLGKQARLVQS